MIWTNGPSGNDTPYQPGLFANSVYMIQPGTTTTPSVFGGPAATTVATVSHPAALEPYGLYTNYVPVNTATTTTGASGPNQAFRPTKVGGGWYFRARLAFPTASTAGEQPSYGNSRIFVGLTANTLAAQVASENPAGDWCGFLFQSGSGSSAVTGKYPTGSWLFTTKDNVTQTSASLNFTFASGTMMDFIIYMPPFPTTGSIYYRISRLDTGQYVEGEAATASWSLPRGGTVMKAGYQLARAGFTGPASGVNNRGIIAKLMYLETD